MKRETPVREFRFDRPSRDEVRASVEYRVGPRRVRSSSDAFVSIARLGGCGWKSAVSVLHDADPALWTRTIRGDEAAVCAFMQSGVHHRVIARLPEWCDEAAWRIGFSWPRLRISAPAPLSPGPSLCAA
jgi:hypothetical protein